MPSSSCNLGATSLLTGIRHATLVSPTPSACRSPFAEPSAVPEITPGLEATALHEFLDADLAFHRTVLLGAHNPALSRTVEESQAQARIFFADRGIHDAYRIALACEQHTEIFDALDKRDGIAASEAKRRHIRTSLQLTLEHLESTSFAV